MNRRIVKRSKKLLFGILGFVLFLALWSVLTYGGFVRELFLPSPSVVVNQLGVLFFEEKFILDVWASVYRIVVGFSIGAVVAIPLGIALGISKKFQLIVGPVVSFIRYMPAAAFVPLAILWLGIGDVEKMFIIFIGTFPYLLLLVADIVMNVDEKYIHVAKTFGATPRQIVEHVVIPASLPGIWDSLRVMFGIGWTYIIVAELVAARSGIGHVIIEAQRYLLTENIIAGLIVIGLLGLVTDWLFKIGYRKFFPYTVKSQRV